MCFLDVKLEDGIHMYAKKEYTDVFGKEKFNLIQDNKNFKTHVNNLEMFLVTGK